MCSGPETWVCSKAEEGERSRGLTNQVCGLQEFEHGNQHWGKSVYLGTFRISRPFLACLDSRSWELWDYIWSCWEQWNSVDWEEIKSSFCGVGWIYKWCESQLNLSFFKEVMIRLRICWLWILHGPQLNSLTDSFWTNQWIFCDK